jgi:hypothetical protein
MQRRAKITDEHRQEAAALLKRWEETAERRSAAGVGSQMEFGQRYDIGNQSAVWGFLHARTPLSIKAAKGFALGLKCQVSDFSPRLAREMHDHAELVASEADWLGTRPPDLSEHALSLAQRFDELPTVKRKQAYPLIANMLESFAAEVRAARHPSATPEPSATPAARTRAPRKTPAR